MLGTSSNPGVIPRVINGIFEQIEAEKKCCTDELKYNVKFSYLEIYNEKVGCVSKLYRLSALFSTLQERGKFLAFVLIFNKNIYNVRVF